MTAPRRPASPADASVRATGEPGPRRFRILFLTMASAFASCLGGLYVELGEPVFLALAVLAAVLVALRLRAALRIDEGLPPLSPAPQRPAPAEDVTWSEELLPGDPEGVLPFPAAASYAIADAPEDGSQARAA
jgi:hypothetical protein